MYARVWKMSVGPESIQPFATACRSVGAMNSSKQGYRGLLVLRGGPLDSPDATVVSLWDSLETLRASESDNFQQAVADALACCQPGAVLREEEILICDFPGSQKTAASKNKKKARKKIRAKTKRRSS